MKVKHFFFGILLLSILVLSVGTAVTATTYTIGVRGDLYTWEIKKLDPIYLDIADIPSNTFVGDRADMQVMKVVETDTAWTIECWFRNYNRLVKDWPAPRLRWLHCGSACDITVPVPKDPHSWDYALICGLPVNEYLTEAFGPTCVEGNKLKISSTLIKDWFHMDVLMEYVYDTSTGLMSSMKYTKGDTVLIEVALLSAIPGYELPILLGITAISTLGLIYLVMKRNTLINLN